MDTCLAFLHSPDHYKTLDANIDLALASIFSPKNWNTDCLYQALRTELGIPTAATSAKLASLQLHAQLVHQDSEMPAHKLLRMVHHILATPAETRFHHSTTYKIKLTLTQTGHREDWDNLRIIVNQNVNNQGTARQLTQKTIRRTWLLQVTTKLAHAEHKELINWARAPEPRLQNQTRPKSGRPQQYLQTTGRDHTSRLTRSSAKNPPFQPFPYITHMTDARLVSNLIRIRSQNSNLPSHIASVRQYSLQGDGAYHRISYTERFCPCCVPPRSQWGLAAPPESSPLGTEEHLLLQCAEREDARINLQTAINTAVEATVDATPQLKEPWYDLATTDKLQTILACVPPSQWALSRAEEHHWYIQLEKTIQVEINSILEHGTTYWKDLKAHFS